jgi:hypothetical protein
MLLFMLLAIFIIFNRTNIVIVAKLHKFLCYKFMCRNCLDMRYITMKPIVAGEIQSLLKICPSRTILPKGVTR